MILCRQPGLPAVFDHHRLMRLDDDGRTSDLLPGQQRLACVDESLLPLAAGKKLGAPRPFWRLLLERRAGTDRLDRYRFDHQRLFAIDEAEPRFVRAFEGQFHLRQRHRRAYALSRGIVGLNNDRRVGAGVTDMRARVDGNRGSGNALAQDLLRHFGSEFLRNSLKPSATIRAERLLDRLLADTADI